MKYQVGDIVECGYGFGKITKINTLKYKHNAPSISYIIEIIIYTKSAPSWISTLRSTCVYQKEIIRKLTSTEYAEKKIEYLLLTG